MREEAVNKAIKDFKDVGIEIKNEKLARVILDAVFIKGALEGINELSNITK